MSSGDTINTLCTTAPQIKDRAATIGVDFDQAVANIQNARDWDAALQTITTVVSYPEYYIKPFHGAILIGSDLHHGHDDVIIY